MQFYTRLCLFLFALFAASIAPAVADDWLLTKARGVVQIQVGGAWQDVVQGAVIPDGTLIRTGSNGRANLARGKEWLDLKAMTMLVVHDQDGKRFTNVLQMSGQVEVEVEARNVQHFAVDTPYLAAVVKGTHFTVTVQRGKASVSVARGVVQVSDNHGHLFAVAKGEQIAVTKAGEVSGKATQLSSNGKPLTAQGKAGVGVGVTVGGSSGNTINVTTPSGTSVNVTTGGSSGVGAGVSVGGTGVGVSVGGSNSCHVNVLGVLVGNC